MTRCMYRTEGPVDGHPVVLLHAIATNSSLWSAQIPVWASAFRLICIDLPGHGDSPDVDSELDLNGYAACVCEVLDELRIDCASLVGLSFGGMVAQAFALQYPERIRSLVLAHSSVRTAEAVRGIWNGRIARFEKDGMESQVMPTLERWFTRAFAESSPLTLIWLSEQILRTTHKGYVSAIKAIQSLDYLDKIKAIKVPALVVAGEEDSAVPPAAAAKIAEQMGNARTLVLAGAAHLGNLERPVEFTEAVGAFLSNAGK
ncbi:alpha/beta fold hydrolase [Pusillimonas sp.]|uniref:alpha/beta fold hydrolase n=1 Tax=Pusillimonas sp. TaxID=3040095 RepID=UPI0037CA710E